MSEVVQLQRYPAWKQAVQDFLAEFSYGQIVPNEWLADHLGLPTLAEGESMTADQFRDRQFLWLAGVEALKAELLRDHRVMLVSVRGVGYRWVHPSEQTGEAMQRFEAEARKMFGKAAKAVSCIRMAELTDEQRRHNVDAAAKLSAISGMTARYLK